MPSDLTVLVADDEEDILYIAAKRITGAGFQVVKASDGDQAVAYLHAALPDIAVLDVNMPGKDGFEVLKELRKLTPSGKWIPVIIVSGRTELADMRRGYDLEADHYLTKPCSMEEVVGAVRLMATLIPLRVSSRPAV
ncbi:MAG: response regulator [Candidatus Omnitrophica bacterium]|nr:response regulator [Candidatus Omnitrophota bacterium]